MQKAVEKKTKINFEIATITPEIAAAWLDANERNRRVSRPLVDRLAHDMRNGKFESTGDTIKFSRDNKLIDGQHRLHACVKAGVPFSAIVVYGLDPDTQNVIDTGKARSKGDMLSLHGVTQANACAVGYRFLYAMKVGAQPTHEGITHADMLAMYEAHPKLPLYVPAGGSTPKGISTGIVGCIGYVASHFLKKKDRGEAMMAVLKTGVPDYEGDPMHKFRERVIRYAGVSALNEGRPSRHHMIYTLVHAWNLFAKHEAIDRLQVRKDPITIEGLKPSQL